MSQGVFDKLLPFGHHSLDWLPEKLVQKEHDDEHIERIKQPGPYFDRQRLAHCLKQHACLPPSTVGVCAARRRNGRDARSPTAFPQTLACFDDTLARATRHYRDTQSKIATTRAKSVNASMNAKAINNDVRMSPAASG